MSGLVPGAVVFAGFVFWVGASVVMVGAVVVAASVVTSSGCVVMVVTVVVSVVVADVMVVTTGWVWVVVVMRSITRALLSRELSSVCLSRVM